MLHEEIHITPVMTVTEVLDDDMKLDRMVHWSKANARGKAIIEARMALESKADGMIHFLQCFYCEPDGASWSVRTYPRDTIKDPVLDRCKQCDRWVGSTTYYDLWCVEEE